MLASFTPIVIRVNGITFLVRKMWRILLQEEVQQKNLKSLGGSLVLSSYGRIRYQSLKLPSSTITKTDPEVKKVNSLATTASRNFELERFEHCSSWQRLKKAVALCLLFKKWLKSKVSKQPFSGSRMVTRQRKQSLYDSVSSTDMQEAELEILKQVQSNVFSRELSRLREECCHKFWSIVQA